MKCLPVTVTVLDNFQNTSMKKMYMYCINSDIVAGGQGGLLPL